MTVDSIPRKLIAYLRLQLPAGIAEQLYFDALALRHDSLPACIVTAHPSIPEIRHGGIVEIGVRALNCEVNLFWDAAEKGRNYDDFEAAVNSLADALSSLQGTDTIGSSVLTSEVSVENSFTGMDVDSARYVAGLECRIRFVR